VLRAVLAVLLAAALLSVGGGAVEEARHERAATLADGAADRLAGAAGDLAAGGTPTEDPGTAPRRTVSLSLPVGDARTASAALVVGAGAGGDAGGRDPVTTRVAGEPSATVWLGTEVRVLGPAGLAPDDEPLTVRGETAVTLWLLDGPDGPVVAIAEGVGRG